MQATFLRYKSKTLVREACMHVSLYLLARHYELSLNYLHFFSEASEIWSLHKNAYPILLN